MTGPRIVHRHEGIQKQLIEELEQALDQARQGMLEGFALVTVGEHINSYGHFDDRLRMIGALHMALSKATATNEALDE